MTRSLHIGHLYTQILLCLDFPHTINILTFLFIYLFSRDTHVPRSSVLDSLLLVLGICLRDVKWLNQFFSPTVCTVHGEEGPVVCLLGRLGDFVFSRPWYRSSHFPSLPGKKAVMQIKYRYETDRKICVKKKLNHVFRFFCVCVFSTSDILTKVSSD